MMRLQSYLRHCSDKPSVCVHGYAGIQQRGKKNKWLMRTACSQTQCCTRRTIKTDVAAVRTHYALDRVMAKSYYYSKRLLSVIAALNKMTFVMS